MKQMLINILDAIVALINPKAIPLSDKWLKMNDKALKRHVSGVKISKTTEPIERNTSSLKKINGLRQYNIQEKNTLKN